MKKKYKKPEILVVEMRMQSIICTSGVNSAYGIGWGGIDDSGILDPD